MSGFLYIIVAISGLFFMGIFFYYLSIMIINFFPMVKNIRDSKYYSLGPIILFSDRFFMPTGAEHRRKFLKNAKKLFLISLVLAVIAAIIAVSDSQL